MRHSRTAHHALVLAAFFVAVASVAPASAQIDPGNTNPAAAGRRPFPPVGQTGRMSIRARAMVLDDSREGTATRCGRLIRVSAIIFSPDTGQTLRKVRVIHRDLGVCADKGRRAAAPVVP